MAKLVDVYPPSKPLSRRQFPLVVDETLTMVMDLKSFGLISDTQQVKGKELEEISRKIDLLTSDELNMALQVSRLEILHVLDQSVPCVGCRRSVERLYYQLFKNEYPTFEPLVIHSEGIVTIREDKQSSPQFLSSIFHGHSARLNNLVDSQPRRNKKSHRCLLHSLDSQRSRSITPAWRDVWDCMRPECKRDVCIIEASSLRATLETYLRKHRFCGDCRTKVQKAYNLLIEDPEPCKEKSYVASLYSGIKRCIKEKHIHLQTKTEYIAKLIGRAEPELLGSRRERHAKTLEIAQEEVLTCIGICMYERLHRIYMKMKEVECTCQVFAAVAVDALCRSFETAVERKQGISQLELLYAEITREEQQKQIRKEQKKLKRKRKKVNKNNEVNAKEQFADEECLDEFEGKEDNLEKDCRCTAADGDTEVLCRCQSESVANSDDKAASKNSQCHANSNCSSSDSIRWPLDADAETKKCDSNFNSSGKEGFRDHSHDCGYSSENNNGCFETESLCSFPSSPEGSELACSDGCCQPGNDSDDSQCYFNSSRLTSYGTGHQLSLQEMLEDHFYCDDTECYITPEEVREFKSNTQVHEVRQQLRETLKKRFAQLCANGPLQVPRFLVQSKFNTN